MTKQEFIDRTGYTPNMEGEFEGIHKLYMNTPYDKNRFCEIWRRDSQILFDISTMQMKLNEKTRQNTEMVDFLIEQSEKYSSEELREKAIEMLGEKEYLRRKINKGYNLWADDKELLNEILK